MVAELPGKRQEILQYLAHWRSRGEGPPSVREVGEAVGLKSSQTVYHHLGRLEQDGYIERASDRHRTPTLTDRGWEAAGKMPFMGHIAAGRGLEAVVAGDDAYSLASEFISSRSGRQRYLLRVVGQSMTGARIEDGDLLVVEENEDPADGSVVVALIDGGEEVTVKRLYREGSGVRLKPQNGDHEDIFLAGDRVRVQGEVLYVVHPPMAKRSTQ
jgi:repressor LexA